MLYLRNSTTHKTANLSNTEKFKADLSVKMAFPYLEFYTNIIYPILNRKEISNTLSKIELTLDSDSQEIYYYGLDGDNTGRVIEELFTKTSDEKAVRKASQSIKNAITKITKYVTAKNKDAIILEAGDDLLFKGAFLLEELRMFQKMYIEETHGLTCSIGFGKTFLDVYLSLKLAKSQANKNSIKGFLFSQSINNA